MFKRIISLTIISLAFSLQPLKAQASLEGQFFEYTSYYLSNFNVNTGESDVPLFRYRIHSDTYPIYTKIWFKASLLSPSLGLDNRETLTEIESNVFLMKDDIIIDNRNFSSNTSSLLDEANPPNSVNVLIRTIDTINPSDFESITSAIMASGKLADGEYRFELKIYSGSSEFDSSDPKGIQSSPSAPASASTSAAAPDSGSIGRSGATT